MSSTGPPPSDPPPQNTSTTDSSSSKDAALSLEDLGDIEKILNQEASVLQREQEVSDFVS
jgi:hypothetical protein